MAIFVKLLLRKNYLLLLLTEKHIKQFAAFYLGCFLLTYAWFAYHGLLFSSVKPVFFLNKLDITHNIFMLTNLQHLLLQHNWLRILLDTCFLLLPLFLTYACIKNKNWQRIIAFVTAAFAIVYCSFLSTMSFVSVENYLACMFIPFIFCSRSVKGFYFSMHTVRLLFIIFFFSAALWKIRTGAVFNMEEMSAILFRQHASYLAIGNRNWYSKLITFFINNQLLSYCFYLFAVVVEFVFIAGLFTKKFDKYLIVAFLLFAVFDYLLMGINYFTWLPFMACFYFSRQQLKNI
jgi:hypothetical protein